MKLEAEREERSGNYGRVAEIRYGHLQALEKELEHAEAILEASERTMIKEEVTAEDIAEVVVVGRVFLCRKCSKASARSCFI